MKALLKVFFLTLFISRAELACKSFPCLNKWLSNGRCDLACMNKLCSFDSSINIDAPITDIILNSDCIKLIEDKNCDHTLLGNGICDQQCNSHIYGWDFGDCSFCSDGCTLDMLENDVCDPICDNFYCANDNGKCRSAICAHACTIDLFQTGCYLECTLLDCKDYFTPCDENCGNGCLLKDTVDNICTPECFIESCFYDNGACDCAPGCSLGMIQNDPCWGPSDPCNNANCRYKNGKCGDCSFWCFNSNLGDGVCDFFCDVPECGYDLGDCGCSPGCSLIYWNGLWWNKEFNIGNPNCLVPQCFYNIENIQDTIYLESLILTQIKKWDFMDLKNDLVYEDLKDCSLEDLQKFNYLNLCTINSTCYTESALWCLGKSLMKSNYCLRASNDKCLVNAGLVYMGKILSELKECPNNFIEASQISSLFYESNKYIAKWCFVDPTFYTKKYPKVYFVQSYSVVLCLGTGEFYDPFLSLYFAFTQVFHRFTKIMLSEGAHIYQVNRTLDIYLRDNYLDPLNVNLGYKLELLQIEGMNPYNRSKVYWKDSLIISNPGRKIEFRHIEFIGDYLIREDCDGTKDICYYCPIYNKEQNLNEYLEQVNEEDKTFYLNECQRFAFDNFFVFDVPAYFENIVFNNIRNQFNSLIKTSSTLTFLGVSFNKIQPKAGGYIIQQECVFNCKEIDFTLMYSKVEFINYGYRFSVINRTGNFLIIHNIRSIIIENCHFNNILIKRQLNFKDFNYLININTYNGTLSILNNLFTSIIVDKLISVNNEESWFEKSSLGISLESDKVQFTLKNNFFFKIFSNDSFVYYTMKETSQSVLIEGLVGVQLTLNKPLIQIENLSGQISDSWSKFELLNIYLESINLEGSLIVLENLNSIDISFLTVKGLINTILKENDFLTILKESEIKFNGNYPGTYIQAFNPEKMIHIENSANVYLNSTKFFEVIGNKNKAEVGIFFADINILIIENMTIISFLFSSRISGLLSILNTKNSLIYNLLILNSANYAQAVFLYSCQEVKVYSLTLENITSAENSPFLIYNTDRIAFYNISFLNTQTYLGRCGALEIIGNSVDYQSFYIIESIEFIKCSGGYLAACFLIDATSLMFIFHMNLNKALFLNSRSESSPLFFISKSILMIFTSSIINVSLKNNILLDQPLLKINLRGGLLLQNWFFVNNTSGYIIFLDSDLNSFQLNIQDFSIVDNIVYNSGIYLKGSKNWNLVKIINMVIENLKSGNKKDLSAVFFCSNVQVRMNEITVYLAGHLITATDSSLFEIDKGSFFNLTDDAILVNEASFISINDCQFYHNYGYFMLVLKGSKFLINKCRIFENFYSGIEYAFIEIETFEKRLKNVFNDTEVFNNTCLNSDLVKISNSFVKAASLNFYSNQVLKERMHTFSIINSDFIIDSSKFTNHSLPKSSSVIYSNSNSNIKLSSSSLKFSESVDSGLIQILDSEFVFTDCNFTQNLGHNIKSENSIISINFCNFSQNSAKTGTDLYVVSSKTEIISSFFSHFTSESEYSSSLYFVNSTLFVSFSIFENSVGSISAIYTQDCSEIIIAYCYFSNIFSRELSAVYIEGFSVFGYNEISHSIFRNNTSGHNGGALGVSSSNLNLINSTLEKNSAYLKGGGLHIEIIFCNNCIIYLTSVQIKDNKANIQGGGVMWIGSKPIISKDSEILNNSAISGENIASQIVKIQFLDTLPIIDKYQVLENVPSGQKYEKNVLIGSIDSYNSLISTDNSSQLNINLIEAKDSSLSGSTTFQAINGIFTISNFTVTSSPGKFLFLEVSSPSVSKKSALNDDSLYISSLVLMILLRNCTNGEQILENLCKKCENTTFLIEPAKECLSCPVGGICPGGDKVFVKPGYYRTSNASKIIYACDLPEACQGNNKDYNTFCLTGYTGIKCGVCQIGYSKITTTTCIKCPQKESNLFIIIGTAFGIFLISFFIVKASIKSVFSPQSKHSIYMKIFTNYLHLLSLMINFNFNWHPYVLNLFKAHQSLTMTGASVVSVDCYIYTKGIEDKKDIYYTKLLLMILFPAGVFLGSCLIWIGICFVKETYIFLKRELILTLNVLFFIIYPSVVRVLFLHFGCDEFDIIGPHIISDLAVKCWDLEYKVKTYVFVLPGILIWAVGVPSLILLIMFKKRHKLHHEYNKITFGYLFNGYKKSAYYWEFLSIYRKLLIISILVFVNKDYGSVQGLTLCLVLMLSTVIQFKIRPYNSKELNKLELYSLSTALITGFCGLYYLNKDLSEKMRIFLFYLICISNLMYIAYWSYWFFTFFSKCLFRKIPFLRRFSKLDGFESEFFVEEVYSQGSYFDKDEHIKKYTFFNRPDEKIEQFGIKNIRDLYLKVFLYELKIDTSNFMPSGDQILIINDLELDKI